MTEDEAKEKWCPHVRLRGSVDNGQDRGNWNKRGDISMDAFPQRACCIASDCALWVEETSINLGTNKTTVCGGHCGLVNK